MKAISLLLIILFATMSELASAQQKALVDSICQEGDLHILLNQVETNKQLQLERMTAFAFHQLLNEYRASKKLKTIYWDDKLWLAARNHNLYLINCSKHLTHSESDKCEFFTGRQPENRVHFVTHHSRDFANTGYENCYGNVKADPDFEDLETSYDLTWEEMMEKAKWEAEDAFEAWKSSMGHNQNMLDSEHLAHGTSFMYGKTEDVVVSSSVFTQKQKYYRPDTIKLDFYPDWENDFQTTYKENYPDYEPYPKHMNRISFKHFSSLAVLMEQKGVKPDKHLYKLIQDAPKSESNKELRRRYLRSTFYLGVFKLMKYELVEVNFEREYTNEELYALHGIEDIESYVLEEPSLNKSFLWAGDIQIENKSDDTFKLSLKTYALVSKK